MNHVIEQVIPPDIRAYLEENFYAKVNRQATLEHLLQDPDFPVAPKNGVTHIGLFSDHGVVHVRDVADQIVQVLDTANGTLIPHRSRQRMDFFMKGYGVLVAYLHDIGMADFSLMGRAIHSDFASQMVFRREFDPIIETLWAENSGNLAWRLVQLHQQGSLPQPPEYVLREILALSNCHSKSSVPVEYLNTPQKLQTLMQKTVSGDLTQLYWRRCIDALNSKLAKDNSVALQAELAEAEQTLAAHKPDPQQMNDVQRFYDDFQAESFAWLLTHDPAGWELVEDVIDTLRALRCADALRQRGTVLKTSGGYEIFVDQLSANAIYALRKGDEQLFLLEVPDSLGAGEANLASTELDRDGNLRVAFHRGAFPKPEIIQQAAYFAVITLNDIQEDVIASFRRAEPIPGIKSEAEIDILIEGAVDNLDFADLVCEALRELNPDLPNRLRAVPSLQNTSERERRIYLDAPSLNWDDAQKAELLARVAESGHNTEAIEPTTAFEDTKLVSLKAGDTLLETGAPASFVYIPFDNGLQVIPLGGYQSFSVRAWMPLGNTGVIRGAARNATVVVDRDTELLMIPRETNGQLN